MLDLARDTPQQIPDANSPIRSVSNATFPDMNQQQNSAPAPAVVAVSAETAARMMQVGRSKVWELIATGELPSFKIGGSRRIAVEDVHAYIRSLRTAGQPA
jgi:excisionase family DNA binding protein